MPPDESQMALPSGAELLPATSLACWRCAKQVSAAAVICPYCEAQLSRAAHPTKARMGNSPILFICMAFAALLIVSIVQAAVLESLDHVAGELALSLRRLHIVLGVEALDTIVVVSALIWTAGRISPLSTPIRRRLLAWLISPFVLAAALVVNFGYHGLLGAYVDWPDSIDTTGFDPGNLTLVIVALCVQPALVEELFFRYLSLGALRGSMGVHAAVWVSSVMFGMAHVGVPISIPMLVVIGLAFGYMRVLSGGLALPMLMHFFHNAVVLFVEHHFS